MDSGQISSRPVPQKLVAFWSHGTQKISGKYKLLFFFNLARWYWWKKSCTTWDANNHLKNGINYLSTGAGILPSTVSRIDLQYVSWLDAPNWLALFLSTASERPKMVYDWPCSSRFWKGHELETNKCIQCFMHKLTCLWLKKVGIPPKIPAGKLKETLDSLVAGLRVKSNHNMLKDCVKSTLRTLRQIPIMFSYTNLEPKRPLFWFGKRPCWWGGWPSKSHCHWGSWKKHPTIFGLVESDGFPEFMRPISQKKPTCPGACASTHRGRFCTTGSG